MSVLLHPSWETPLGPGTRRDHQSGCHRQYPHPWRGQAGPLEELDGAGSHHHWIGHKGCCWPSVTKSPGFWLTPGDQVASLTSYSDSRGVGGIQGGLQWRGPKS